MNDEVEKLLATGEPGVAGLARRLCELILELYPDAVVSVDRNHIGFGSTTGYKGLVFVVALHSKHVNLGVYGGATLADPAGLMEGTGKVHRHVKIRRAGDLERPELPALMVAALSRQ
jgi:hypothetical protein